jgi:ATP-dependent helicase HrpB
VGALVAGLAGPHRQRRGGERRYRLSGGGGAILPEHDALAVHDWLAVATTDGASGDQKIYLAAPLTLAEIEELFADQIEARDGVMWDGRARAVAAQRSRRLGALVLEERPIANADPEAMTAAMLEGIRDMGLAVLPWSDAAQNLRARVTFLRRLYPDAGWPDLSDAALTASLDDWLRPYLAGMTRKAHLERLDLHAIMQSLIPA